MEISVTIFFTRRDSNRTLKLVAEPEGSRQVMLSESPHVLTIHCLKRRLDIIHQTRFGSSMSSKFQVYIVSSHQKLVHVSFIYLSSYTFKHFVISLASQYFIIILQNEIIIKSYYKCCCPSMALFFLCFPPSVVCEEAIKRGQLAPIWNVN
jgi:hypothetical protein